MKKLFLMLFASAILLSSCAFHNGFTTNINNHTTKVVLSKKNYKIIEKVKGTSNATYIFGLGGLSKKSMIEDARSKMLSKADLIGSSKAVINETVEISNSVFPFIRRYKVTISAYIIEFTE